MSELTKKIIENIVSDDDFPKVLRDVASALKAKGFFQNPNWSDDLIKNFKDVIDVKVDDSISFITDNEHEISNSFTVGESSKFNKKPKISTDNGIEYRSLSKDDMFDDSNDSFEIPETQAFPPIEHPDNDDELDSEGFITMPDDGIVGNNCSQSQALLQGTELGMQSPHQPDLDDDDTLDDMDMEISKLQWDDSATDNNDKNKSASVTPELDFDLMTKLAPIKSVERAFDTQDTDFGAPLAKSIFDALDSPHSSVLSKAPSSLGRNEIKKSSTSESRESSTNVKCADNGVLGVERIDRNECETSAAVKCAEDEETQNEKSRGDKEREDAPKDKNDNAAKHDNAAKDVQAAEKVQADEDVQKAADKNAQAVDKVNLEQTTANEPVENQCDDEMPETQFFFKADDDIEKHKDVEIPEDQLFKIPGEFVADAINKSKRVSDVANDAVDDGNENFDETQLFFKLNVTSTEEDIYDVETQAFEVANNSSSKNQTSLVEDRPKGDGNSEHVNVDNVDVATNGVLDESEVVPRPKVRRRNRLIESSDEEDNVADYNAPTQRFETHKSDKKNGGEDKAQTPNEKDEEKEDAAAELEAQTQIFEARKQQSPRRKRISELKGGDWEQLCESANNNQGDVVFKGVFDRCKDLRKVQENNVSVASVATNQDVVAEAPIRQSVRRRAKLKNGETNDADPISSKRQKLITEPITFKVPVDTVPTAAKKPDNVPLTEVKPAKNSKKAVVEIKSDDAHDVKVEAPKDSSKVSKASTKSEDPSQPSVKASKASSKASTKSNSVAPPEVKASKESLKVPLAFSEQDETDENVDLEMQHTQVFVKASSTPKEQTKSDRPRRQARAATMGQERSKSKVAQPSIENLRQSVTYSPSPKVTAVQASADLKENVFENAKSGESVEKSTADVSRQTRKRKASDSNDSGVSSSTRSRSPSVNRSSRNQKYPVMFTMVDSAPHSATLKKLNIIITADSSNYNALITDKVYRTAKFMCAVAAGKPIVSFEWLKALETKNAMVDPFQYLLKDGHGERKYKFNQQKTLQKIQQNGELFRNHSILVTPNTTPSPDILKDIIASSGGKYLKTSLSARKNDTVLCISAEQDKQLVVQLKKKYPNLKEITAERFMEAIFQYKI